jgi:hypothetical protein
MSGPDDVRGRASVINVAISEPEANLSMVITKVAQGETVGVSADSRALICDNRERCA